MTLPTPSRSSGASALRLLLTLAVGVVLFGASLALLPAESTSAASGAPAASAGDEPQVILYATSWCGWCRKTRALLDELEVEYADKDIETSEQAAREYRDKAGPNAGVPVLDIAGTIVRGYDERRIRELVSELDDRTET
jgi:glutaredoxin